MLRYVLIIFGIAVLLGCLFLSAFLYTQNIKLTQNVKDLNISTEDLKKRSDLLNNDNQKLKIEISNRDDLLLKASREKKDLENKIADITDNFKNNIRELEGKIQEGANLILKLQKENLSLGADNTSLKKQLEGETDKAQFEKDKEESDSIDITMKMKNLKGLMPGDFVTDFEGDEEFLQNCSTPLCAKINLNNEGIKYARLGQWQKAEETFKGLLKQYPDYRPAKLNLGLVYDKSKSKREAMNYWLAIFDMPLDQEKR